MPGVTRHATIAALATALLNVAAIAGVGIAAPQGAMAECIGPWTPMPSFTEVAPTAKRVVVGTVIRDLGNTQGLEEDGGVTPSFVIEVDTVLRGPDPGPTLTMDIVRTGVPQTGECGSPTVFATVGDRIAVAFDGTLPGSRRRITAAAWIEGRPDKLAAQHAQVLTMAEVRRALLPLPDTSTSDGQKRDPAPHAAETLRPLLARLAGPSSASLVTRTHGMTRAEDAALPVYDHRDGVTSCPPRRHTPHGRAAERTLRPDRNRDRPVLSQVPMRRSRILSGFVILAAALGALPAAAQSPGPTLAPPASPVPFCMDLPEVAIPDERFGDTPVYVGNEQPTGELQAWASQQPGFEDLWIDRDHFGWVVLAFSEDAAARQADLEREFPDAGVVAIEVDWTRRELDRLHRRASRLGDPVQSVGTDILRGVVEIGVGVLEPGKVAEITRVFAGERVCIAGIDPATLPAPGPQPRAGDGWRLLGHARAGAPYRTGVAADRQSFRALWKRAGMPGKPPAVDFEQQVAIWFGAVYGSSCPKIRLDEVVVDTGAALVHPVIVRTGGQTSCTDDANGHAYLVALDRDRLPAPPFRIQLQADDPPPGAGREITLVRADLRVAGSVPVAGEVRTVRPPQENYLRSGGVMETCCPVAYQLDARCGVEWLGQLNGIWWRTDLAAGTEDWLPDAWRPSVDADGMLEVIATLREAADPVITDGRPRAEATLNGETVLYHATMDAPPPCSEAPSPAPSA